MRARRRRRGAARRAAETFRVNEISSRENFAAAAKKRERGGGAGDGPKKPAQNRAQLTAGEIKEGGETNGRLSSSASVSRAPPLDPSRRFFQPARARIDFSREESSPCAAARARRAALQAVTARRRLLRERRVYVSWTVETVLDSPPGMSGGDGTR